MMANSKESDNNTTTYLKLVALVLTDTLHSNLSLYTLNMVNTGEGAGLGVFWR